MTLILFIVILGTTVLVHETGHYLFARLTGVHVYEFSIGMGPAIYSKVSKKTQIKYAIRAIPLGGYVQLAGEDVEIDDERKNYPGKCMQDKNAFERFLIMFFGAGFNFIFAFLLILITGFIFGAKNMDPVISEIQKDTPASIAGFTAGDEILSINNYKINYVDDVSLYLQVIDKTKEATFKLKKTDGKVEEYKLQAVKQTTDDGDTYIYGIMLNQEYKKGLFESFEFAFKQAGAYFKQMFVVIGNLFTGRISVKQLSGPVGIYNIVGQARSYGALSILTLMAFLSINVGVINLLPFPAFDGGRILFLFIEKVKGSPVNPKIENIIHSIGFILLLILMVYVTFNDLFR